MKELVRKIIEEAAEKSGFKSVGFSVEQPPKREMGDWATNVAMIISGAEKANTREVAEKLIAVLQQNKQILKAEIAGPGFINITLANEVYFAELSKILFAGEGYGRLPSNGRNVNVEYVSANPTGPLHIGNARSGPIGEALSNLFEFCGYGVTREFYVNDVGVQIKHFGQSLYYWYDIKNNLRAEMPAGGYPGPYIKETSELIQSEYGEVISKIFDKEKLIEFFTEKGLEIMVNKIRGDLKFAGMEIDVWSYESKILAANKSQEVLDKLKSLGDTVEKDGAIWFKQPDDPELSDKDAVLVKSDTQHSLTYFANDIAYHLDKIERGAEKLIDVWGANHFGHIPRMKAALKALGHPDALQIVLYQYVRLSKSGVAMSMAKRQGNFVTLREVIESGVAPDAFKYFILSQNPNTPFDFDIELAADTSEKNPVFYIKYAHARICSILTKIGEGGAKNEEPDFSLLTDPKELALYKELVNFPGLIEAVLTDFQVQSLPHYAYKVATLFHDFYSTCRVITEDAKLSAARLSLIKATKIILANTLGILGIEAPEKM